MYLAQSLGQDPHLKGISMGGVYMVVQDKGWEVDFVHYS